MNFLYVSRQFNRSGYYILKELLKHSIFPMGVLLSERNEITDLDHPSKRLNIIESYKLESNHKKIKPLKFFGSIKLLAEDYQIPVYTRKSLKRLSDYEWLKSINPDLIVLGGGWPELIPTNIINLPVAGLINTHPSLLPEFRGTDIHRWQIYEGVKQSGATIHYIDETFDTGEIIGQQSVKISVTDTPQDLFEKTAKVSGKLMVNVIKKIQAVYPNKLKGKTQIARTDKSKYFSRWKWENTDFMKIQWDSTAERIHRFILASTQESFIYNGPFCFYEGKKFIVRDSELLIRDYDKVKAGEILKITDKGIIVGTSSAKHFLLITQIQLATGKGYPNEQNLANALTKQEIKKSGIFMESKAFE